jgi:cation transport ATPase
MTVQVPKDIGAAALWKPTRVDMAGPMRVLAACAIPLLAYQLWTIAAWLGDHPHQITQYRTHGSTSWYSARVVEVLVVTVAVAFLAKAVRDSSRERRPSVDALLMIGMASAAFWDPIYNWIGPAWVYSDNFLNVNDWLGHAPLVPNPVAGRTPWPIIVVLVGYPVWGVGFAAITNAAMRAVRRRRLGLHPAVLGVVAFVVSVAITALAYGLFEAVGLMAAPGYRLALFGDDQIPVMALSGGVVFAAIACMRFAWKLRRRSVALDVLCAIAACQLAVIVGWGTLTVPASLYASPYPHLAPDLRNGLCVTPHVSNDRVRAIARASARRMCP